MPDDNRTNYDEEPVVCCARCYSLAIKYEESIDSYCCADCGCTDSLVLHIDEWEKMYERRYGHKFAVRTNDPRKSPIFKLSIDKLKMKLFELPSWRTIINNVYPTFPKGLGKADSIILLFDKLVRDNKIDDLRLSLIEYFKNKRYGREEVKDSTKGE